MRRAGVPWLTIAKITGHQSIENLVQHYDLNIEVRNCIFFYLNKCFSILGSGLGRHCGSTWTGTWGCTWTRTPAAGAEDQETSEPSGGQDRGQDWGC